MKVFADIFKIHWICTEVIVACLLFPQTEQTTYLMQPSFAAALVSKVGPILFMKTFCIFIGCTYIHMRCKTYIYDNLQNRTETHMTEQVNWNYSLSQKKT